MSNGSDTYSVLSLYKKCRIVSIDRGYDMDRVNTKTILSFSILDAIYWAFYAASAGFLSTYMLECGMSNSFLSIDLAFFMVFSFFGAFFWGGLCDKKRSNKKIFIPEFILTVIVALGIFFFGKINIWISAVLYPVFGFLSAPLGSNLDSWMLKAFHQDAFTYGRARGTGSAGYAISALAVGQLISLLGYGVIPVSILVCAVVVLAIVLFLKEEAYVVHAHQDNTNPMELLKVKPYIFMLVIIFLTGLALSPYNNLKIVVLKSVGGDVGMLGIDSFVGVMVQAVFIFISGSLKRLPRYFRMFIMTSSIVVTLTLCATASNPYMIVIGTVFSNISYGFMLPTVREITENTVSGSLKNTAHSLSDAMFGSFAGMIALLYSGSLIDAFGVRFVAMMGIVIMVVPVCMTVFGIAKEKKEQA